MKYNVRTKLGFTLLVGSFMVFFSSCYETHYYHRYHHHTRPWYDHHHMPPPPGVDFNVEVR